MKKICLTYMMLSSLSLFAQKDARMIVQTGHFEEIVSMNFSPNGKWLATGGKDRLVLMYDVKTGLQMATLTGLKDWVTQLEFSSDNTKIIGLSSSTTNWSGVYVWDVASSDTLFTIPEFRCGNIQSFRQCALVNRLVVFSENTGCQEFRMHDLKTGKKIINIPVEYDISEHWSVTADGKTILYEDEKFGNLVLLNAETGVEKARYPVDEFKHVQTHGDDIAFISNDNKFYHRSFGLSKWLKINLATGEMVRSTVEPAKHGSVDRVHVNKTKSQVYASYGSGVAIYSLPEMKFVEQIEYPAPYGERSAAYQDKQLMAVCYQRNIYFIDLKHKQVIRQFTSAPVQPLQAVFSNNGKNIAIADYYAPVKIWDLLSADAIKTVTKVSLNSQRYEDLLQFSPDDKVLFTGGNHPELVHLPTLEHKKYYDHFYINISGMGHHRSGERVITPDFSKVMYIHEQYDMATGHMLCEYERGSHTYRMQYTRDGKYGYQSTHSYEDDSIKLFIHSSENCALVATYKIPDVYKRGSVAVSNDAKKVAVAGTGIAVADFLTGKILHYVKEEDLVKKNKNFTTEFDCSALGFSPDGKLLAVADETTSSVGIYDIETGKIGPILKGHSDKIYTLQFSPDGTRIVTVGEDKKVIVWNALTGTIIATLVSSGETDYVIYTPDNYYMCSKNGLTAVAFRVKNKMFRAEQFDLRQNRPDTVLQRLGYATKFSIKMYKKAWQKRIKRAGFTEEMLGSEYEIPVTEIQHAQDIPGVTAENKLTLDILFSDSVNFLDRYNVYVNDVPVYGINGVSLRGKQLHNLQQKVDIELSYGINQIVVTAFNSRGTESIRESVSIVRSGSPASKPHLYIMAVGISSYKDKARDLTFAAKDATDFTNTFKTNLANFDSVHVKLITNTDATRMRVVNAGEMFKKAKTDDQIILYFSGHGLLDEQLNYYLAMHDVDFVNPANGGLLFQDFEKMVDSIPCRNRLILVDACHSGEVDKDDAVVVNQTTARDVTSGTRSGGATIKPKVGLKNSLALMKHLFTDTQKGNGATVISAAGGLEYALESKDWNNGVFTYSILQGMREKKADANFDKKIRVSELQLYVTKTVYQLTKGAQQPTTRTENAVNNFVVY